MLIQQGNAELLAQYATITRLPLTSTSATVFFAMIDNSCWFWGMRQTGHPAPRGQRLLPIKP